MYSADQIPLVWGKPAAFVLNTEAHNKPGEHWVAIYVSRGGDGYYFDSFGTPPHVQSHLIRIRRNCRKLRWYTQRLQSRFSNVCGEYCIMFLYYMATGMGIKRFWNNFSNNLEKNDEVARRFVEKFNSNLKKNEI